MSDRPLFDANVQLDQMLDREPFADNVIDPVSKAECLHAATCFSAVSINVIDAITRARAGARADRWTMRSSGDISDIIEVDAQIIHRAVDSSYSNPDHASQHVSAPCTRAMHLLSRELAGFGLSKVPVGGSIRTSTAGGTTESAWCGHQDAALTAPFSPRRPRDDRILCWPLFFAPLGSCPGVVLP